MRVLLSFVGKGSPKPDMVDPSVADHRYDPASYRFREHAPGPTTPYVQRAILDGLVLEGQTPDLVLVAMTPGSRAWQWEKPGRLRDVLLELDFLRAPGRIVEVDISEDLDVANQWKTFQAILDRVPRGADLYVDLTHGFRAIPILFSTAIHFLMQVKEVKLGGAFYGAYEPTKNGPFSIIDMKNFFAVNRWAEAVRSVAEDANPALMAELAETDSSLEFSGLQDEDLVRGLERLGSVLKNSDTRSVASAAEGVISAIAVALPRANPASKLLLELVLDKFEVLARQGGARRFTPDWYDVQLAMATVLLDHQLPMQGLTVLRELVVSWCEEVMTHAVRNPTNPGRTLYLETHSEGELRRKWGKDVRKRLAETFAARLYVDDKQWNPSAPGIDPDGTYARGFIDEPFNRLFAERKTAGAFAFLKELGELRNVLNHGFTGKTVDHATIRESARDFLHRVSLLTPDLVRSRVIGNGVPDDLVG